MCVWSQIGMLFVRCRGGISHSPEEWVMDDDVWAAGLALFNFIDQNVLAVSEEELEAGQNAVAVS